MIDTGSSVSLVNEDFLNTFGPVTLQPYPHTVYAANRTAIPVLGQINLDLEFAGLVKGVPFVVVQHLNSNLILGNDTLSTMGAKMSFARRVITTKFGKVAFTCTRAIDTFVFTRRRLALQDDQEFPPHMGVSFSVNVDLPDGVTVHFDPCPNLFHNTSLRLPFTIDRVKEGKIMISVVNATPIPLKLSANRTIGHVTTASHIETAAVDKTTTENKDDEEVLRLSDEEFLKLFPYGEQLLRDPTRLHQVQTLLLEFRDRFRSKPVRLDKIQTNVEHPIITTPGLFVQRPPYSYGPAERKIIDENISDMKERGIIRPSTSPWSSPVVLVRKKDGTIRFCIDYRALNRITRRDMYPLPRIDVTIDSLSGMVWFSTLDCVSGYWQILMDTLSIAKTAFATHRGLYEFLVMPFGLVNAPMTFQRSMDMILSGLSYDICLAYRK